MCGWWGLLSCGGLLKGAALESGFSCPQGFDLCDCGGRTALCSAVIGQYTDTGLAGGEWHLRTRRGVYRLYAFSNIGSILGLLIYPLLLEPFLSLQAQWLGFCIFLLLYSISIFLTAHTLKTYRVAADERGVG